MRKDNRFSFAEIQVIGNELKLAGRDRFDAQPRRRLGEPLLHRMRRPARGQLPEDSLWNDDLTIEAMQKLRQVRKNQLMKRLAVCDNDHRPDRIPRSR